MSINDGIKKAKDVGLDLVEISPNTDPPICKILDFGKYRYQLQKMLFESSFLLVNFES